MYIYVGIWYTHVCTHAQKLDTVESQIYASNLILRIKKKNEDGFKKLIKIHGNNFFELIFADPKTSVPTPNRLIGEHTTTTLTNTELSKYVKQAGGGK